MTTYSYTVTLNDNEHIYLERLLNEIKEESEKTHGFNRPSILSDILFKLGSAQIRLRSYTEEDEDKIPTIKFDLTKL